MSLTKATRSLSSFFYDMELPVSVEKNQFCPATLFSFGSGDVRILSIKHQCLWFCSIRKWIYIQQQQPTRIDKIAARIQSAWRWQRAITVVMIIETYDWFWARRFIEQMDARLFLNYRL